MRISLCWALAGALGCAPSAPPPSRETSELSPLPTELEDGDNGTTEDVSSEFPWTDDEQLRARIIIPDAPRGLVWAFHGAGGGLSSVLQTEWVALYNELVANNIGVVLTQSLDRDRGRWEEADVAHIAQIWSALTESYDLPYDLPMGAITFSAGANMAERLVEHAETEGWRVAALALHQGPMVIEGLPVFYVAAENDEIGRNEAFYEELGLLETCVEPCVFREGQEIDLLRHRFARIPGVDAEMSEYAFAEAIERGMVDAAGVRQINPDQDTLELYLNRYARALDLDGHHEAAATQLRVVWATHRFSSEFAVEQAEFFRAHFELASHARP